MKKILLGATLLALLFSSCGGDDITSTDAVDTTSGSDPTYSEADFDRTVTIVFNAGNNATVSGVGDGQTVTVSGDEVTIVNSGDEKVQYELSGTATDGFFKLYSEKKQALVLNSVSIANSAGAAINVQSHKTVYVVLNGTSTLADGSSYSATPSDEDEKAAFFSEGQLLFSGSGSLTVTAKGKSGIVSDDYVKFSSGTVTVNCSSSCSVSNGDTLKPACIKGKDEFIINGGTLTLKATGTGAKGISGDGTATFNGGTVDVTVTGSNFGSSGGSQGPWGGNSSNGVAAKGIKFDGNILFAGGKVTVSASNHEGIESKGTITVTGGEVYSYSSDDAINSASTMTISDGYVCALSTGNDGLDANGNLYISGGVVFASCTGSNNAEVAIDANTEGGYKLYISGGIVFTCGSLERGSSLTQSCWSASSWSSNVWYSLDDGNNTYAFKTPTSGGSTLVVSAASQPTVKSNVTVSGGTSRCNSMITSGCTVSGGSSVSLSTYNSNSGGGPGGGGPGH